MPTIVWCAVSPLTLYPGGVINRISSLSSSHLSSTPPTIQTGRLDLSFTKCSFPNDYLPYVGASRSRRDNHHTSELILPRSNSIDLDFQSNRSRGGAEHDFGFAHATVMSTPQRRRASLYTTTMPNFRELGGDQRLEEATSAAAKAPSASTLFTTPLSWYNTIDREPSKPILTPTLTGTFYHDTYNTRPALANTLPYSTSPTSSSSCLTSNHPMTQGGGGGGALISHHQRSVSGGRGGRSKMAKSACCCLFILMVAIFIVSLSIVIGFSLYLTVVTSFFNNGGESLVYKITGNFKVSSGDHFTLRLLNRTSDDFVRRATRYNSIVSLLFVVCFSPAPCSRNTPKDNITLER